MTQKMAAGGLGFVDPHRLDGRADEGQGRDRGRIAAPGRETVAIFPWRDVIEDFLDPLGVSLEDYARHLMGGWLSGYVAALQRQGLRVVIVHASENVSEPTRLVHEASGAPIWLVPGRGAGGGVTRGRPSLRAGVQWSRTPFAAFGRVLRQEGCAAMLVQDYEHARADALVLLAKTMGLRVFATYQGGDATRSPLERTVRRLSIGACDALVVPSGHERARLATRYRLSPERLRDIPNPVDGDAWRAEPQAEARQALGLSPADFLVINHGRVDIHRKGLDVLLAAWAKIAGAQAAARLVILGSDEEQDAAFGALVSQVPQVTWAGRYVSDPATIRRWLSAADAYVTLPRAEGAPVAPLEAMACGLPVVASDAPGLTDLFGDGERSGGIVVPRDDAEAAAGALLSLAADLERRRRIGAAGRSTIERRHSVDAAGEALAIALSAARS
ncbi:glycosyltransferase family 1 protein [Phenylobacterium hankyongense]|uniref:Glycosyltransferase family 1 protein n=1 Tax=Phenylobacterium hankyongense TaxID=1813876 RepID=A0A328AWX8_9CAUL|nr:glycosyltransferase family 4 protein [Phenylobacterium hankyongense]RAK59590.1 glycosyltransferase family 1 protein [Phenylobacterium hankyongense]